MARPASARSAWRRWQSSPRSSPKNLRGQDNATHIAEEIAEEIADVEIMLEQLKLMFSIRDEVTQQRTVKLQRLDNRISQSLIHPKP